MQSKNQKILAAALTLAVAAPCLSVPASAQVAPRQPQQNAPRQNTPRQTPPRQNAATEIIALQAYVDGRSDTYGIKPAEAIPVNAGERVRIHLVGTAIVRGNGEERPVNARFSVAAGRDEIDIVRTGPDWVEVQAKSRKDDGIAQIGYQVNGNYEMKGGLREGRITLQIGDGDTESAPGQIGTDRDRWNRSQELTSRLYRSILGVDARGDAAREDTEHIYESGPAGVRDVAMALADDMGSRYDRLSEDQAVEVLGDLYRGLLRRTGNDRELWDQDRGFRTNVDTLRREGFEKMVQVIVDSGEFQTANGLRELGSLAGRDYDREDWRTDRQRHAVPRPPVR